MSYHKRKGTSGMARARARRAMAGLGDASSIVNSIEGAINQGTNILNDPYFGEMMCRLGQIRQAETGQPITACQQVIDGMPSPGGLSKFMMPLRAYTYAEQNKWVFPLAAFAVIGVPFLLGYMLAQD